jgi:hypothetical protein
MHEFIKPSLTGPAREQLLLFTGLLPPRLARRATLPDVEELSQLLIENWRKLQGRAWPWRGRESTLRLLKSPDDIATLLEAGNRLLNVTSNDWNNLGRGLRLEANTLPDPEPIELYGALLRGGADSVFLRWKDEGEMSWSWPLRIALAHDSKLLHQIDPENSLHSLFKTFNYENAPMRANVLFYEGSLSTAAEMLEHAQTDSVIIFGGLDEAGVKSGRFASQISESTGAQAVVCFEPWVLDKADNLSAALIANLSHDLPIDSAVGRLSREFGIPVISWATRSFAEVTSVREQGRILARRLQELGRAPLRIATDELRSAINIDTPTPIGLEVFHIEPRAVRRVAARDLGNQIADRIDPQIGVGMVQGGLEPLEFHQESAGAKTLATLSNATAKQKDKETARQDDRHLQVRVETPGGRSIRNQARMLPAREYVAAVFIGALNPAFLGLNKPLKAPPQPDDKPLLLDVLFWEPQASPEPKIAQLSLPARGNTSVATFPFRTAENQSNFSARIAVYHRNRNLQTGLLRGRVGDEPAELQFTPDAMPLTKFVGLADRAAIDVSIIVNDTPDGEMQAYVYRDGQAAVAPVSDEKPPLSVNVDPSTDASLAGITQTLGRAITRITNEPEEYEDLTKEGSRTLLIELAQHGHALLTRLRKHSEMADLFDKADYIQIVSAHVDAFFPIEYLYDGKPPRDNATVCNGCDPEGKALLSGQCCGAYDANPSITVCPLRFWSLSKVIERHAHLPEHTRLDGKFQLRSYPLSARNRLLDPLAGAVLAASKDAATEDKDVVKKLITNLDAVLRTKSVSATNWRSWTDSVETTQPHLLVLLPHHEQEGGFDFLEIGGDKLKSVLIDKEHVRSSKDDDASPIVLLIGCQTNSAKVDLESFVPSFQDAGAVIIVSTIATILGRHAGPAATAIVQELKKQEGDPNATFGKVMLEVKRKLLAAGIPMVLGLTSYGDADWRIGGTA